jgi:hypothetical protein
MRSLRSAISASKRGARRGFVFQRLDDLVEEFVDVGAVVALQRALERAVLDVDDRYSRISAHCVCYSHSVP